MDIHDHIKKLYEETEELNVWYASAYDAESGCMDAIGYRSDEQDPIIDGVVWMIAGDMAINVKEARSITKFNDLENANENDISIILHAQAIIGCSIVTVHLGTYVIVGTKFAGKNGYKTFKLRRLG